MTTFTSYGLPKESNALIDAIQSGNCVAFVGSGFSAAARYPQWKDLLNELCSKVKTDDQRISTLTALLTEIEKPSSREFEMAAQLLLDAMGEKEFQEHLRAAFDQSKDQPEMAQRLKHLRGIPFRAIVTTNFDPLLRGEPPSPSTFRRLLRSARPSPWQEAVARAALDADLSDDNGPVVVQLHGTLEQAHSGSLVFTRSQYRRRLYANPAYLTTLRSLLATSTVLFLGYSLTDAYLNEIRAELVEALSGEMEMKEPLAWAVLNDVSEAATTYYTLHEGLGVLPYPTKGGNDHSGFDHILKAIYDQTNPIARIGKALSKNDVLWFDPNPDNNNIGRQLIHASAAESGRGPNVGHEALIETTTVDATIQKLQETGRFSLVISHWGHAQGRDRLANGEVLLRLISEMRSRGTAVPPVVIFASGINAAENRQTALRLGAVAYTSKWEDLMSVVEELTR